MHGNDRDINVTESFTPPIGEYSIYLGKIWKTRHLTSNGPLLKEFEQTIIQYLKINNFQFIANGTLAIQIALRSLNLGYGEIITTPFSYVATSSAILWEGYTPVYVDIDPDTLCINAEKIEESITPNTKAILAVHVFGNTCDIEKIDIIAKKHNLKVIYDAAHSFGVKHMDKSVFEFGDISTTSFHATKLFHTIEGGGIFTKDNELNAKIDLIKRFGHYGDDHKMLGINAKASEFQAAMGLCNLKYIDRIIINRKRAYELYDSTLKTTLKRQQLVDKSSYNYAYFPVILPSEIHTLRVIKSLNNANIYPRRYFYPSLNKLSYIDTANDCPLSVSISQRILCLPMYYELKDSDIEKIVNIVNKCVK